MPSEIDTTGWCEEAKKLYAYWREVSPPGAGLPGRQHIDPLHIPGLLPFLWLMEVAPDPRDNRYRLIGTAVTAGVGKDYTGRPLREAHPRSADEPQAFQFLVEIAESRQPRWFRGKPRLDHYKDVAELENLILPLASDGQVVDVLLGMTKFYRVDGTPVS
jgi:hypothetical protein